MNHSHIQPNSSLAFPKSLTRSLTQLCFLLTAIAFASSCNSSDEGTNSHALSHEEIAARDSARAAQDSIRQVRLHRQELNKAYECCQELDDYGNATYAKWITKKGAMPHQGYWKCYRLGRTPKGQPVLYGAGRSWNALRYDWKFVNDTVFQTFDHYSGEVQSQFSPGDDGFWYGWSGTRGYRYDTKIRFVRVPSRLANP